MIKTIRIINPHIKKTYLLKGETHTHTKESDGGNTPTELLTEYKNKGYAFVCITDHNVITCASIDGLISIVSVEDTKTRHITAYDITEQSASSVPQEVLDFYHNADKLCSLAHLNWDGQPHATAVEVKGYTYVQMLEVYNANTNSYAEEHWDEALSQNWGVLAIAVDDCHNINDPSQFDKGYVLVNTDVKNKDTIMSELRAGNFYASNGNDIEIITTSTKITASSTELSNFSFIGLNGAVLKTVSNVTTSTYAVKQEDVYVRVKSVKVSDNSCAWSQTVKIEPVVEIEFTNTEKIASDCYDYLADNSIVPILFRNNEQSIAGTKIPSTHFWISIQEYLSDILAEKVYEFLQL